MEFDKRNRLLIEFKQRTECGRMPGEYGAVSQDVGPLGLDAYR